MSAFTQRLAMAASGPALARAGVALLAALCLVLAVRVALLLLGGPTLPAPSPRANRANAARTTTPLAGWHLFGTAESAGPEIAHTTLALTLRGTFAAVDSGKGIAFIADANGHERSYQVGDTLPGDAVLESVFADHVIVRNGGQRERLGLPGAAAAPASGEHAAPANPAAPRPPGDPSGGFLRGVPAFGAPDLATARSERAPELAALAQTANLLPVAENGHLIGVRIRVPDPAVLERFGLTAEDVVTAVNGIPLDGPERRDALEQSLRAGGIVTLTVRRGGAERQLSLGL